MTRIALAIAVACALPVPAAAETPTRAQLEQPGPRGRSRTIHMIAIAAGFALYASSETLLKNPLSPDHCRWCDANALDRSVRDALLWSNRSRAALLSNLTGYVAAPVATTAMLVFSAWQAYPGWTGMTDDLIPMLEAVLATQLVTSVVKISAARQRPYAHFAAVPPPSSPEDNLSFFSGHSSATMSLAVSMGMIAQRRGYRLAPLIWATGTTLALTTMYLRIAADRHYFTDVITGATVGAAFGYLVPRLTGTLPEGMQLVPTASGVAVAGAF